MSEKKAAAIHEYLTLAGKNGQFAAEVIKLILEEKTHDSAREDK
jgi:hypothetical protein